MASVTIHAPSQEQPATPHQIRQLTELAHRKCLYPELALTKMLPASRRHAKFLIDNLTRMPDRVTG